MAHLVATQAVDFTDVPELELLIQNPVYSSKFSDGFRATLGNHAVQLSGNDFAYGMSGAPTDGEITEIVGYPDVNGARSFTITLAGPFAYDSLISALELGVDAALDIIFNGDDVLDGSAFDDTLFGYDGADILNGNEGNDFLDGRFGADVLNGGKGRDVLVGGGEDQTSLQDPPDTFVFSVKAKKENADKVTDFAAADEVHLENGVFKKLAKEGALKAKYFELGNAADDANDFVLYNPDSGRLFYDKNGDGEGGRKLVAKFTNNPDLDNGDMVVI